MGKSRDPFQKWGAGKSQQFLICTEFARAFDNITDANLEALPNWWDNWWDI